MLLLVTGKVRRDAAAIERNNAASLKWKWNRREGGREGESLLLQLRKRGFLVWIKVGSGDAVSVSRTTTLPALLLNLPSMPCHRVDFLVKILCHQTSLFDVDPFMFILIKCFLLYLRGIPHTILYC
jgi:hypothetical protein